MSVQDKDAMDNAILDIKSAVEGTVSVEDATATTINSTLGDTNTKLDDNNTKLDTANSNLVTINGNVVDIETLISTVVNNTLSTLKTTEQAPMDQQVLSGPPVLNAVTSTGASTAINTLDKGRLTLIVEISNAGSGATVQVEGSGDGDTWDSTNGQVGLEAADGTKSASVTLTDGVYVYKLLTAPPYARVNVPSRDTETITAYLVGGAV